MTILITIIIFIVILAALILVHEFGHFVAAKLSGIRVDEFALGFPPKLFSFKKGETRYSLNLIPFGGYVKIFGENPDEESMEGPQKARSFVHKPKYIQLFVLIAGILMNILFAWALFSTSLMVGLPATATSYSDSEVKNIHLVVTEVGKDSPAEKAGIKFGDTITTMESEETILENESLTPVAVQTLISETKGGLIHIHYKDGNVNKEADIKPVTGIVKDKQAIGIAMGLVGDLHLPFFNAIYHGGRLTLINTKEVAVGLYTFLERVVVGKADFTQVSGPVGIVGLVGDASKFGFAFLLSFTAIISLNLAVINILPFPALDGGRIFFVLIEMIIRRPIKPEVANALNGLGFALLLLLMAVVTFKDVAKLF